jgi:hypothetical protein
MIKLLPILMISLTASSVLVQETSLGQARTKRRAGPAERPFEWPDFGGTPDIVSSTDLGLGVAELKTILERLKSPSLGDRAKAVAEVIRNAQGSESVLRDVLWSPHGARNAEIKQAILVARSRGESIEANDSLLAGLISIDPSNQEYGRGATGALRVLSMLRALDSLDTMAAYKVIIEFAGRHAGVFRLEIGKTLVAHGFDVLPALIYGRGSDDSETHMFAVKWIRDMGNPLLSEQVKIKNPRRLAQLLEAYASVNELDAIDVVLSMTNHDSSFVRDASRESLRSYGRNALWPVRRLYENTFGKEPEKNAAVEGLLSELYDRFDTQRLAGMMELFNQGLAAFSSDKLEEMEQKFREVLKNEPLFLRRGEMAQGFLKIGRRAAKENEMPVALRAFRMAARVAQPGGQDSRLAKARLKWIAAEAWREDGVTHAGLYKEVLDNDPGHEGARSLHDELTGATTSGTTIVTKAFIVSLIIFLCALIVFLRTRNRAPTRKE